MDSKYRIVSLGLLYISKYIHAPFRYHLLHYAHSLSLSHTHIHMHFESDDIICFSNSV